MNVYLKESMKSISFYKLIFGTFIPDGSMYQIYKSPYGEVVDKL